MEFQHDYYRPKTRRSPREINFEIGYNNNTSHESYATKALSAPDAIQGVKFGEDTMATNRVSE